MFIKVFRGVDTRLSKCFFGTLCGLTNYIRSILIYKKIKIKSVTGFEKEGVLKVFDLIPSKLIDNLRVEFESTLSIPSEVKLVRKNGLGTQVRVARPFSSLPSLKQVFSEDFLSDLKRIVGYDLKVEYLFVSRFFSVSPDSDSYGNLWHFDYISPHRVRLIISLNDIASHEDASCVLSKEQSKKAIKLGYKGRKKLKGASDFLNNVKSLEDCRLDGKAGCGILFDSALTLHRQGVPEHDAKRDYLFVVFSPNLKNESVSEMLENIGTLSLDKS